MGVPLAVALPAVAAGLAYLDGRWRISNDIPMVLGVARLHRQTADLEKKGRLNQFYALEALALGKDLHGNCGAHKITSSTPQQECLVFGDESWSFKSAYDTILKYAGWLKTEYSVQKGEVIAMDFSNCEHFIFIWMAIWSLGAIPAFINYNLTGIPLTHCIKISKTRLVLVEDVFASAFTSQVRDDLKSTTVAVLTSDVVDKISKTAPYRAPDSDRHIDAMKESALLVYTSGTTGLPKAALMSWFRIYAAFSFIGPWLSVGPADRYYTPMPLYHTSAAVMGFLLCLGAHCTFILSRKFSTKTFWPEVRSSRATVIQYVGETLRYLLSAPPSELDSQNCVRVALGNGLRPDIWQEFKLRFDIPTIAEFYAASESPGGFWNLSSNDFTAGAIGSRGGITRILGRNSFTIIENDVVTEEPIRDPQTGLCKPVSVGQKGETLFNLSDDPNTHPRARFNGYFDNETATTKKLLFDVLKKGDCWYRTGDIMTQDSEGRIWFSDRIGDTFRWKAENVSTFEVAEVLGRHPSIAEANVYGVQIPHHDGRAGMAAIILKLPPQGATSSSSLPTTLKSLSSHLRQNLPRYAIPLFLRVMTEEEMEVDRTGNNKQTKHRLRNQGVDLELIEKSEGKGGLEKGKLWWWSQEPGGEGGYVEYGVEEWRRLREGEVKL